MKHILDYQKQKPEQQQTQSLEMKLISWIWAKLAARYGSMWTNQISDERMNKIMRAEWAQKLSGYQDQDIMKVVDGWMEKYPPTLPALVERLKPIKEMHRIFLALPKPKADPQKAIKHIQEIKRLIK